MTLVIGHVPVSLGEGIMGHGELAGIRFFEKKFSLTPKFAPLGLSLISPMLGIPTVEARATGG